MKYIYISADETSIQKLKDAGVEHLCCTVESNGHLKFLKVCKTETR